MKYLYVITSDTDDCYAEQALLSITSLKLRNPDGAVSLLTDAATAKTLPARYRDVLDMADEMKAVVIDGKYGKAARSRWLKTSMRRHVGGDFLFIDCDTAVAGDLGGAADIDACLGAVPDHHAPLAKHPYADSIRRLHKKLGLAAPTGRQGYFNSGVILCRDTPACHEFFSAWHEKWLECLAKGVLQDQPAFNQANLRFDLTRELDGGWNCQAFHGGLPYLADAKIIHYFATYTKNNLYLLADPEIYRAIRSAGRVPGDVADRLRAPKTLFRPGCRVIADKQALTMLDSALFSLFAKAFRTAPARVLERALKAARYKMWGV